MAIHYSYFKRARQIAAVVAILGGIAAIGYFLKAAEHTLKTTCNELVIVLWTLVPPVWFFLEYWARGRLRG